MDQIEQMEIIYREALHAIWRLQAVMPAECNPEYPAWLERWNAQQSATELTRDDLVALVGNARVAWIIMDEMKQAQKPKAEA